MVKSWPAQSKFWECGYSNSCWSQLAWAISSANLVIATFVQKSYEIKKNTKFKSSWENTPFYGPEIFPMRIKFRLKIEGVFLSFSIPKLVHGSVLDSHDQKQKVKSNDCWPAVNDRQQVHDCLWLILPAVTQCLYCPLVYGRNPTLSITGCHIFWLSNQLKLGVTQRNVSTGYTVIISDVFNRHLLKILSSLFHKYYTMTCTVEKVAQNGPPLRSNGEKWGNELPTLFS